jgi:cyclophilin family peptidyl-prolyl cis-trans isomerase
MRRSTTVVGLIALCACAHAGGWPAAPASEAETVCSAAELEGRGDPKVRAMLTSPEPEVRARAALAAGRLADPEAVPSLTAVFREGGAGSRVREVAAWALGRIPGGDAALLACLKASCAAASEAARALGTRAGVGVGAGARAEEVAVALAAALSGPSELAREAGLALGVLARGGRGTKGSAELVGRAARKQLVAALGREETAVRTGAAFALGRVPPRGAGDAAGGAAAEEGGPASLRARLASTLGDRDATLRVLSARAWGIQGLPANGLVTALRDQDWRVRVEAARGLASAPGAGAVVAAALPGAAADVARPDTADARWAHPLVALLETAAQVGVPLESLPAPGTLNASTRASIVAVRCAAAQARDRVAHRLAETPLCAGDLEPAWRSRRRTGAFAAAVASEATRVKAGAASSASAPEGSFLDAAQKALADADARVRAAAAAEAGAPFARELGRLLSDPDPFVVAAAAGALAKDGALAAAALPAAKVAAGRLSGARGKGAGDPASDALAALAELFGAAGAALGLQHAEAATAVANLLPAQSPFVHRNAAAALRAMGEPVPSLPEPVTPVPAEAGLGLPGAGPRPHVLSLITSAGELRIELRSADDEAPLTAAALATLARRGFYDGLIFHRVVPDFVVQGGDPRGDGDGGPGWALPDEHTPLRFLRGTMGIATNGSGTGGSQIFLCHSAQPHLDGRYTVVGQLVSGEEVLDALQPGDEILSASAE